MKYYLATTGISEIWDTDGKLLLSGPWCLISKQNKKILENKEYTLVHSPWKPSFKIKEAADFCHQIYEELLPQVSESLNSVHQVSYPVSYWRILLGPWLLYFIGILYDRYKRIERTIEIYPNLYTHVLPKEQCKLVSFDTYDFFSGHSGKVSEDYYNLKLFSLVAYDLCPYNIIEKDYKFESKKQMHPSRHSLKRTLFYRFMKLLDLFFKCPLILCDMYHLSPHDIVLLRLKSRLKLFSIIDPEPIKKKLLQNNYSYEIRNTMKLKGAVDKFQSLLYGILPEAIPLCYLENYKFYRESISNINSIDSVKIAGSAVGWLSNEGFKFFAAEAVLKGANLIDFQHGGNYGVSLAVPDETLSLEKDMLYTWGWNSKKNNKVKPLPSPHLSKLKDTYSPQLDNILFVGVAMPLYHTRFHTLLMSEDMPKYFEYKKIFFQALPDKIRDKILYRPYTYDYGWKELDIAKKVCPNAKFVLKGKLIKWMKKAKLVVIDHPHTSFIEALTINVPSIFYWDHEVYLMRSEVEEYFELLRNACILHRNPISAAKKVNEIFYDPMSWWLGKEVQNVRLKFCERFGYARKDWTKVWVKELSRIHIDLKRSDL